MSLLIDDKTLDELNLALEDGYDHPASPPTRDYTMEIAGRAGEYDFGADIGPKPFSIPLIIKPQPTKEHFAKAVRALGPIFFDQKGKPKTVKIVFTSEPEKYYNARYSGSVSTERHKRIGKVDWPLTAFDPYAYADSTAYDPSPVPQYDTGLQYDSGLMYPNPTSFDWLYSRQMMGLYNYAYLNSPVRMLIRGSVINPRITNETTGQTLTINLATNDDDLIVVDTQYYQVVKSTPEYEQYFLSTTFPAGFMKETNSVNIFGDKYGDDDLFLAPGKNSLIFEGGQPNASVQVIWKHRFL